MGKRDKLNKCDYEVSTTDNNILNCKDIFVAQRLFRLFGLMDLDCTK